MQATQLKTSISEMAQTRIDRCQFLDNPYFSQMTTNMSLKDFQESQGQFYHAVRFFARPMSMIIARIPDPYTRLTILHNIVEEHGEFQRGDFHEATFRKFLISIGHQGEPEPAGPAVDGFNCLLSGVCSQESVTTAICCIGMIEHAFAGASALIGRTVVDREWVTDSSLVHYKLHAELDIRHAAEFFEIVEADPKYNITEVTRGLDLGIYAFDRLYRDLCDR